MKSSTSRTVPTCVETSEHSSGVRPPRLVDEDADDRTARAAGEFDVDEFEAALFGRAPRDLAHARFDGSLPAQNPSRTPFQKPSEQKKKWARTHWTTPPRSEQEANYTGRACAWQPGREWAVSGER